jgi:hypothetical protein
MVMGISVGRQQAAGLQEGFRLSAFGFRLSAFGRAKRPQLRAEANRTRNSVAQCCSVAS